MNEWEMAVTALKLHGKFIFFGIMSGLVLAIFLLLFQKPVWQAEMIIGPTERTGVPSLASFLPQTAADAPALQYFVERIDATHSTDFTLFETLLNSAQTVENLSRLNADVLPVRDPQQLQLWLDDHLKIKPLGMTPYRKVTLRHTDKNTVTALLGSLYKTTDQTIRQDKKIKAQRRIAYLNEQLKTVQNPDHRDAIIALLKEQEQTAMMVSIDHEFAAELIEPPHLLPKKVAPNAIILIPLLVFASGFIGLMLSGFQKALKS